MKKILYLLFLSLAMLGCKKDEPDPPMNDKALTSATSKFTLNGNYLYVASYQVLDVYNISGAPKLVRTIQLNNTIETISTNGSYLFMGTANGLLIYGLDDPENPVYRTIYYQILSCSPVVVKGNLAYVSISTGTVCNMGLNQLEVLDISDITKPLILKIYKFNNPRGMAIRGNYLYLCDAGLKVLDITDYNDIKVKSALSVSADHVAVTGTTLTVTGESGVYQYDCTDPLNLKFISKISVH
jgi:hypothetical protein